MIQAAQALGYWLARREQPRARDEEPVGMAEAPIVPMAQPHVRTLPLPFFRDGAIHITHSDGRVERVNRLRAAAYAQLWFDVIRAAAVSGGERG